MNHLPSINTPRICPTSLSYLTTKTERSAPSASITTVATLAFLTTPVVTPMATLMGAPPQSLIWQKSVLGSFLLPQWPHFVLPEGQGCVWDNLLGIKGSFPGYVSLPTPHR